MTWRLLDMPEEPADVARWLDRQLVGLRLRDLAAELTGVHGDGAELSVDELLGPQQAAFLVGGFAAIDHARLEQALAHPRVLVPLQDLVAEQGGEYWRRLAGDDPEVRERSAATWKRLTTETASAHSSVALPARPVAAASWYSHPAWASLATAAALLLAFFLIERPQPPGPAVAPAAVAWGWAKPDALPQDVTAEVYLTALSNSANAWFNNRPEDAPGVARRIGEFRQGCSMLLLSEHKPLSDEQRTVLREKCRAWAKELDVQLAELEAGKSPIEVRGHVDELVQRLMKALGAGLKGATTASLEARPCPGVLRLSPLEGVSGQGAMNRELA